MVSLLKANLFIILRQKSFWCITILAIVFCNFMFVINNLRQNVYDSNLYITKVLISSNNDYMLVFLSIPISIFLAYEFKNQTIKIITSRGISRTKYYLSKLISSIVMFIFMYIIYSVISMLVGGIVFDNLILNSSIVINIIKFFLLQFISIMGLSSFFVFIGFIVRNDIATVLINILSVLIVHIPIDIVDSKIGNQPHESYYLWVSHNINYLNTVTPDLQYIFKIIIVGLFFLIFFTFLGQYLFKKLDI